MTCWIATSSARLCGRAGRVAPLENHAAPAGLVLDHANRAVDGLVEVDRFHLHVAVHDEPPDPPDDVARPEVVAPDVGEDLPDLVDLVGSDSSSTSATSALARIAPSGWLISCEIDAVSSPTADRRPACASSRRRWRLSACASRRCRRDTRSATISAVWSANAIATAKMRPR